MHPAQHAIFIVFLFALGACVGSFLNVVVWRLPRGKSLVSPPSHCPRCQHRLAWYDNVPVFGWIFLRGRCRYCGVEISARYPIVEFITGAVFVFYYLMFFIFGFSPCAPQWGVMVDSLYGTTTDVPRLMTTIFNDWPIFLLYLFLIASLLAISLIDAELYIIPLSIPWLMAGIGILVHTLADHPRVPGAVMVMDKTGMSAALAAGGALGLVLSIILFRLGLIPQSFPEGEPALEIDEELARQQEKDESEKSWAGRLVGRLLTKFRGQPTMKQITYWNSIRSAREPEIRAEQQAMLVDVANSKTYSKKQIRAEIRKEILFLLPPMVLGLLAVIVSQWDLDLRNRWRGLIEYDWVAGMLGSVLGALVGALVVWAARIFGTLAFGRVAMGLGDAHLMFGAGAIVGAGAATVAFFLAPFAGILVGVYGWLTHRKHELPYGPYLSLATAVILLLYCPIEAYLAPGMDGLGAMVRQLLGGTR